MYKRICITNRHLVQGDFLAQLDLLLHEDAFDSLILREKDLTEPSYRRLAESVIDRCNAAGKPCILHTFVNTAIQLRHPAVHLPLPAFLSMTNAQKNAFSCIGVSIHTVEEAHLAERNGAAYVTAGHIFPTDCKKDLAPRGTAFLRQSVQAVDIPVYALGGIHPGNIRECLDAGAAGVCMMSYYMRWKGPEIRL